MEIDPGRQGHPRPEPAPGAAGRDPGAGGRQHGGGRGIVALEPSRAGRDAGRIADEVIAHLIAQLSAEVTVTLEIDVTLPEGANDQIVRTVAENGRTLRFTTHGFEAE